MTLVTDVKTKQCERNLCRYSRNYTRNKATKIWWSWKMKIKFWSILNFVPKRWIEDWIKIFRLFDSVLSVTEKLDSANPQLWLERHRIMRCQAEIVWFEGGSSYSTFKRRVHGSEYSAHHSRLSVLLIPLSYLIPTVQQKLFKTLKRCFDNEAFSHRNPKLLGLGRPWTS